MLKVNTKKIPIEEFAKKYGLVCRQIVNGVDAYIASDMDEHIEVSKKHKIITIWSENELAIENGVLNVLFDMITNGDLVKE
jgi:hypothetical protein